MSTLTPPYLIPDTFNMRQACMEFVQAVGDRLLAQEDEKSRSERCSLCHRSVNHEPTAGGCICSKWHPFPGSPSKKAHSIYEGFEWEGNYGLTKEDNG